MNTNVRAHLRNAHERLEDAKGMLSLSRLRIPGQGGRDSEINPVSIPK